MAAAIKQANSTDRTKIKAALEALKTPSEGLGTTYNKPFSTGDKDVPDWCWCWPQTRRPVW